MRGLLWRWRKKDFGFRFRSGGGKARAEFYQANEPGAFYTVPAEQRKLSKERVEELAMPQPPTSPRVVPMPWIDYDRDWDWITNADGILLNFAGCLEREEVHRREDEGVARAMELIAAFLDRSQPIALTTMMIRQVHTELMGAIYPFAGAWRTVSLHKGDGPTKWPLPPAGIEPLMDVFERDVLSRSPFVSDNDDKVFAYVSEFIGEFLAIHPFREGNGRTAFILGALLLMQNDLLPLDVYDQRKDEARYYAACEEVRVHKDYGPLAGLIAEWEQAAQLRWEAFMVSKPVNVKAILADAELRRKLMVSTIQATQAREGIDTSPEQADRAYFVVTELERASFFDLQAPPSLTGGIADRHDAFVAQLRGDRHDIRYNVAHRDFASLESSPLAYDRVGVVASLTKRSPSLGSLATIVQGVITRPDEPFLRRHWEVSTRRTERPWKTLHKGGEFSRFYFDADLVIDWSSGAQAAFHRLRDSSLYFREGLTWPRAGGEFSIRRLPPDCVFSDKGPAVLLLEGVDPWFIAAVANSTAAEYIMRARLSRKEMGARWELHVIKGVPIPSASSADIRWLSDAAREIHDAKATWDSGNEMSTVFSAAWLANDTFVGHGRGDGIQGLLETVEKYESRWQAVLRERFCEIEERVFALYGVNARVRRLIIDAVGARPPETLWPQMRGKSSEQKCIEHVWRLISYAVKCVIEADGDGMVSFNAVNGEPRLVDQVRHELASLFPGRDANQIEVEIVNELKKTVKGYRRCASLDEWLDNVFFEYHCRLYKNRPVFWHIASAQGTSRVAFGALVHYHRFDKNRMAKLRSSHLRDAIEEFRREAGLADKAGRSDDRLEWQAKVEEAQSLDKKLQLIQEGHHEGPEGSERDFRILTPWKKPGERPKGWDPDLDDGVKVNIEPFEMACVLRIGKVT